MTLRFSIVLALLLLAGAAIAAPRWHWIPRPRAVAAAAPTTWYASFVGTALAIYPMEETNGAAIADMSGNNYTGTVTGCTLGGTNGVYFNGTASDYITLPTDFAIGGRTALTVCVWIKPERIQQNDGYFGTYQGFFGQQSLYSPYGGGLIYAGNANDYNHYGDASAAYTQAWHHFAFVYDGGQATAVARGKIYFDATNQSVEANNSLPTQIPAGSYSNWKIGTIANLTSRTTKGRQCRFLVMPTAMSAEAVTNLYNTSRPGMTQ
jgi:hypothetical protein